VSHKSEPELTHQSCPLMLLTNSFEKQNRPMLIVRNVFLVSLVTLLPGVHGWATTLPRSLATKTLLDEERTWRFPQESRLLQDEGKRLPFDNRMWRSLEETLTITDNAKFPGVNQVELQIPQEQWVRQMNTGDKQAYTSNDRKWRFPTLKVLLRREEDRETYTNLDRTWRFPQPSMMLKADDTLTRPMTEFGVFQRAILYRTPMFQARSTLMRTELGVIQDKPLLFCGSTNEKLPTPVRIVPGASRQAISC
jgi:hypothetical protein